MISRTIENCIILLKAMKAGAELSPTSLAQYDPVEAWNEGYIDGLNDAIVLLETGQI